MEIALSIIGVILTIGIPLFLYLRKKYSERPKLEIEINWAGGSASPKGLSAKNPKTPDGYIDGSNPIHVWELEWRMKLTIRNFSDQPAYYTRIYYLPNSASFTRLDPVPNKPILNSDEIVLKGEYRTFEECRGAEKSDTGKLPDKFNELRIALVYQNGHGTKFYTVYEHGQSTSKNKHLTLKLSLGHLKAV